MNMPKLTAEASLYRTSRRYSTALKAGSSDLGLPVLPQLVFGWEWGLGSALSDSVFGQLGLLSRPYLRFVPMQPLRAATVRMRRFTT
jgi:hypothetical protein